jgi:iron complex transport system substrate-binding protein
MSMVEQRPGGADDMPHRLCRAVMPSHLPLAMFVGLMCATLSLAIRSPHVAPATRAATATLTDMAGVPVSFPSTPTHALMVPALLPDYAAVADGVDAVAAQWGRSQAHPLGELLDRVYGGKPSALGSTGSNGTALDNIEALMLLRPDALLTNTGVASRLRDIAMPGVVAIDFRLHGNIQANRMTRWTILGTVTGHESRARYLIDRHLEQRSLVLAEAPRDMPAVRVAVLWPTRTGLVMPGVDYYLNDQLETVGVVNVGRQAGLHSAHASLDQLLALDPDAILLDSPRNDPTDNTPTAIYAIPQMQALRAVRARRVYEVPAGAFQGELVDEPLMMEWLLEILRPTRVRPMLRSMLRQTYCQVYGYRLSEDQIDQALLLDANGSSAGYERLDRDNGQDAAAPENTCARMAAMTSTRNTEWGKTD